ncbi:DUF4974 domain-containing protein [Puteibacter caeruleilacunae]|nr:DUF4974 domain-containing protein [Puteibacter caeruleilacunae]
MDKELLVKYILGELSDDEKTSVLEWILESDDNQKEFSRLKSSWAFSNATNNHSISDIDKELNRYRQNISNNKKVIRFNFRNVLKYAAILIITFTLGITANQYVFNPNNDEATTNTLFVPPGQSATLTLSDGTRVWINSGSKLTYPSHFEKDKREVALTGEAYFDVVHNKEKPFRVATNSIDIQVLGTSFNVEAYKRDNFISTTLVEGKVELRSKSDKLITPLKPGQNAKYDRETNSMTISNIDTKLYTSWRNGRITFKDERIEDIARKLERWYNVRISIENEELKDQLYTGTILRFKPIDQILEVLRITGNIQYNLDMQQDRKSQIQLYKSKPM